MIQYTCTSTMFHQNVKDPNLGQVKLLITIKNLNKY